VYVKNNNKTLSLFLFTCKELNASMPAAVLQFNSQGILLSASSYARDILRLYSGAVTGVSAGMLFPAYPELASALEESRIWEGELELEGDVDVDMGMNMEPDASVLRIRRLKAEVVPLSDSSEDCQQPSQEQTGGEAANCPSSVLLLSDIPAFSEICEEMQRNLNRKNSVIRVISHELRSPFSTARHFFSLMESRLSAVLSDSWPEMIREMTELFSRSSLLVDTISSLTDDIYGPLICRDELVVLDEIFDKAIAQVHSYLDLRQIELVKESESDLLIRGDKDLLYSALQYILSAIALELGGASSAREVVRLEVNSKVTAAYVRLVVSCQKGTRQVLPHFPPDVCEIINSRAWGTVPGIRTGISSAGLFLFAGSQLLEKQGIRLELEASVSSTTVLSMQFLRFAGV
jgi:hypothetical protein